MSKWISIKKNPPKREELYYIFPHKYDYVAYYNKNGQWTTTGENGYEYTIIVTHYMRIPTDPQEINK